MSKVAGHGTKTSFPTYHAEEITGHHLQFAVNEGGYKNLMKDM